MTARPLLLTLPARAVALHYVERGAGAAVVFVHMGGRDYRYWRPQLGPFARRGYRVVAYSRRFAYPNANPPVPDYSPQVDADDLAALIDALGLAPAHVVASSIGACAALFLAAQHPELVRSLIVAEPPMLEWARAAPGGDAMIAEFLRAVWHPAGDAFRRGEAEQGMGVLMDYFVGPGAFARFPARLRVSVMESAGDWAAHTTSSDPFPTLARTAVRELPMPVLMLSGGETLPLHHIVDAELERLLPPGSGRRIILSGASHDVWGDAGDGCRAVALDFLANGAWNG